MKGFYNLLSCHIPPVMLSFNNFRVRNYLYFYVPSTLPKVETLPKPSFSLEKNLCVCKLMSRLSARAPIPDFSDPLIVLTALESYCYVIGV